MRWPAEGGCRSDRRMLGTAKEIAPPTAWARNDTAGPPLVQQQSTLVRNSKDLADYEKTLVQMAAELDRFRQNDVQSLTLNSR